MSRDHEPVVMEEFNGFWARGDHDSCPMDHFTESLNVKYEQSSFSTRDGLAQYLNKQNIVKTVAFNNDQDGFLMLDSTGHLFDVVSGVFTNILTIVAMKTFKALNVNGYAYITPQNAQSAAISGEFLYVYRRGSGAARKACGSSPVTADGALAAADGAAGTVEAGYHVFGVVYETDTGFLSQIGPQTFVALNAAGAKKVNLTNICVSPSSTVTKRHIVASKAVTPANWINDTQDQQMFFVPNGTINDNTSTTLTVDFFDSQLIDDASGLLDLFSSIPSCDDLAYYHNRIIVSGPFGIQNGNVAYVSNAGDQESFDQVSGLIAIPNNGLGICSAHVYRDVLYLSRINNTWAFNDNNDIPANWPAASIDDAIGCAKFGLCTVGVYEGSEDVERILTADYNGIWLFNGTFLRPELSWKIRDYWVSQTATNISDKIEFYDDPINYRLYLLIPDFNHILVGDYSQGINAMKLRWSKWTFAETIKSITLFDKDNKLIIATSSYIYAYTPGATADAWSAGTAKIPDPTIITALLGD